MAIGRYLPSSSLARPGVCTSSTRPASPYEGQAIYETDTDKTFIWNGSLWVEQLSTTIVDAKGDLIVGTSNDTVTRLPVGANNTILYADSSTASGVKWVANPTMIGGATQYGFSTVNPADVSNGWFRYGGLPEVTMETGTLVYVSYQLVAYANTNLKLVYIAPSVSGATTLNGRDSNWSAETVLTTAGYSQSCSFGRPMTVNAGTNEFYLELLGAGGSYALSFRASMQVFRLN
jgi:hypothetical protein